MGSVEQDNNNTNTSILVLRPKTRTMISCLLNPIKLLRNAQGIPRDWQGLAELCGISGELIPSISQDTDPTTKILKFWHDQSKAEATVDKLINYLEQLDRCDVVDDIRDEIAEDLQYHKEHSQNGKTVSPFNLDIEKRVLTGDDFRRLNQGLEPQLYDAFVLFAEDDIDFATKLIENMEKNYDLKFCVKERDLLAGGFQHDAVIELIAERCGRLIVILSPAFLESNANKFFYSIAQKISIEQRQRKIIPCVYKDCGKLPPELDCYFKLDIRRSGALWNFWDKLHDSIKVPEKPRVKLSLPENSLFGGVEMTSRLREGNAITRSASNSEQRLSPNDLKSSLHKDTSAPRNITQSVQFSHSMTNLPNAEVPKDNIVPSTSANSLGSYEDKAVRKSFSFLRKFKSLVPKSKPDQKRSAPVQQQTEKSDEINNKENSIESKNDRSFTSDNPNNDKRIKQEKKEKKKMFTLKRSKKKAVLVDT